MGMCTLFKLLSCTYIPKEVNFLKIWEAMIYAFVGGITELLPISFSGHSILLQNMFHISSLFSDDGPFIRGGISIGIAIALYMVFQGDTRESTLIVQKSKGRNLRNRRVRREEEDLKSRVFLLTLIGFVPMLLSFLFLGKWESTGKLTMVTVFFCINGILIFLCTRGQPGKKGEREITLYDTLLMGLFRMLSVFPGLSSVSTSLCIGRARGLSDSVNIRITYMLTLGFQVISALFYIVRGIFVGSFYGRTILSFLIVIPIAAVVSFFALITFRNIVLKNKLRAFMYYCFDAAAIAFIVAIING